MGAGNAGYKQVVEIWNEATVQNATTQDPTSAEALAITTKAEWEELDCVNPNLTSTDEMLDTTGTASNDGNRSRIAGLSDWSFTTDIYFKTSSQEFYDAQARLFTQKENKEPVWVRYLPFGDDSTGLPVQYGRAMVESINFTGDVGGIDTISITLQSDGKLTSGITT